MCFKAPCCRAYFTKITQQRFTVVRTIKKKKELLSYIRNIEKIF